MISRKVGLAVSFGVLIAVIAVASVRSDVSANGDEAFLEKSPKGEIQTVAEFDDLMHGIQENHKLVQQALLKKDYYHAAWPARLAAEISNIATLHGKPDQFKEYSDGMRDAWLDLASAAEAEDFENARLAFGQVNDFCSKCHDMYRHEDEHEDEHEDDDDDDDDHGHDHDDHEGHDH